MKITFIIILVFVFIGCKKKEINQIPITKISQKIENNTDKKDCKCYNGLEETPIKIYTFSDNNSISICGYKENDEYSEFVIFDSKTEKLICEYDATQTCKFKFENDKLHIIELDFLPTNEKWEWNEIEVAEEIITIKNNSVISDGIKPLKIEINISEKTQTAFLDLLETNNYKKLEFEDIVGRLEILSICGNKRASKKLHSIEHDKNYLLDGANAEQYKDAISTVDWRNKE